MDTTTAAAPARESGSPTPPPRFTEDWFGHHLPGWERLFFGHLGWPRGGADRARTVVEIGSFEGRASLWMLDTLLRHPESRLHCLDTFEGGGEHWAEQVDGLWDRFRANLASAGPEAGAKVEVHRGPSAEGLLALLARGGAGADFVYIDGSHEAPDVLADLVLAWRLLAPGGVAICDDYLWTREPSDRADLLHCPKIAVDAFTTIHRRLLDPLTDVPPWQVGFRKRP